MKIMQAIAQRIITRAKRTPYFHLPGYMHRYWLLRIGTAPYRPEDGEQAPGEDRRRHKYVGVRVHHITASDPGQEYHDHPWWYITIILRGGYTELTPIIRDGKVVGEQMRWRGPGHIRFRRASSWHRLVVRDGDDAWTLFIMGRPSHPWGFLTARGKVGWKQHQETASGAAKTRPATQEIKALRVSA